MTTMITGNMTGLCQSQNLHNTVEYDCTRPAGPAYHGHDLLHLLQ